AYPTSGVTLGPDGTVYGATFYGGNGGCEYNEGCGTLFKLTPSNGGWTESLLHTFGIVDGDGVYPSGSLIRDEIGAIYGTTAGGGAGSGTVYKLTPSEGNWSENVIYSFGDRAGDGGSPTGGVILDSGGILYGTTSYGGSSGWGTVFQLARSELGWEENILYSFQGGRDGATPQGGLIVGGAGDLYGTTSEASSGRLIGGTVFRLTPSGSDWVHTVLHSFPAGQCFCFYEGPVASLTMDAAGNLYGTTYADGAYLQGSVFKLTRTDEGWTYISLHDFTGGSDGRWPMGSLTFDANGNLYGTASGGGDHSHCYYNGCGVIFEIKP
ncbi:MAG: choice-of-anchor tandem repeat GloVer-containing protein, partial [Candidatus Korobacteraceae bacterium]